QRDGVGLENPHPDRQDLLPVLVAQDDDRHIRHGIDHEALDRHLDLHSLLSLDKQQPGNLQPSNTIPAPSTPSPAAVSRRPHTLCGPVRSTTTPTVRPIHAAGPGRFTTTLVLVRPDSSVSRRRLMASTNTSTRWPSSCAW